MMAKIEVDEEDFARYQKTLETLKKINLTKEGRVALQRLHKGVDPNALAPDLEAAEKDAAEKTEWQKKFEDLETKIQADKEKATEEKNLAALTSRFEAGRQALRERRYTKEGIEAVEKFMEERGIADHIVVADHMEKQNPPSEIMSPRAFGGFNFIDQPKNGEDLFLKALLESKGDNDGAVLGAAIEAVGEIRNARR